MNARCIVCGAVSVGGNYVKLPNASLVCETCNRAGQAESVESESRNPSQFDALFPECPSCSFRLARFISPKQPNEVKAGQWARIRAVCDEPESARVARLRSNYPGLERYPLIDQRGSVLQGLLVSYAGFWAKAYEDCPNCGENHPAVPEVKSAGSRTLTQPSRSFVDPAQCPMRSVAVSPDGAFVAAVNLHKKLDVWDLASGAVAHSIDTKAQFTSPLAFARNGEYVLIVARTVDGNQVVAYSLPSMEMQVVDDSATNFAMIGQKNLVTASNHRSGDSEPQAIRYWRLGANKSGKTVRPKVAERFLSFAPSPDGALLAYSDNEAVRVVNINTKRRVGKIPAPAKLMAISPDGSLVATHFSEYKSEKKPLKALVWDVAEAEVKATLEHDDKINSLISSPRGDRLATCSDDGTVKVLDVANLKELCTLDGGCGSVADIAFGPTGEKLYAACEDDRVLEWQID